MTIRYSPRATRDLESIREYLSKRSPQGAINVLTAIYAAVEFIRRHPGAAEATRIRGVRAKIVRRYRFKVFYRVNATDSVIEIVHDGIRLGVCGPARTPLTEGLRGGYTLCWASSANHFEPIVSPKRQSSGRRLVEIPPYR
jgi:toxin ParE1/3/4